MMKSYPEYFNEGYAIGSAYGTFPGAIWNGGRAVIGITPKAQIESILNIYNQRDIPVRFTWTNTLIGEKECYDTYCNLIMRLADNGLNQVLVNSPALEKYLRENYPSFKMISSTTKRITDKAKLVEEFEKDYYLVVLDYDLNHDEEVLRQIVDSGNAGRCEILVNEVCYPGCPKRKEHYEQQSRLQLEYDTVTTFPCPNIQTPRKFSECMNRPAFIKDTEIGSYIERGFRQFKIAGRGMPEEYLIESYLYFLVRPEYRELVKNRFETQLRDLRNRVAQGAAKRRV
jgi:collagenase-like PrtC family protease